MAAPNKSGLEIATKAKPEKIATILLSMEPS